MRRWPLVVGFAALFPPYADPSNYLFTRNPIRVKYDEKFNGKQACSGGLGQVDFVEGRGPPRPWSLMTSMCVAA